MTFYFYIDKLSNIPYLKLLFLSPELLEKNVMSCFLIFLLKHPQVNNVDRIAIGINIDTISYMPFKMKKYSFNLFLFHLNMSNKKNEIFIIEAAKKYFTEGKTKKMTNDHPAFERPNYKANNKYCFDKYGLIIRINDFGKKTVTGYIIDKDGEKLNLNVDQRLGIFEPDKIRYNTMVKLFSMDNFSAGSVVGKLYQIIYPDYFS